MWLLPKPMEVLFIWSLSCCNCCCCWCCWWFCWWCCWWCCCCRFCWFCCCNIFSVCKFCRSLALSPGLQTFALALLVLPPPGFIDIAWDCCCSCCCICWHCCWVRCSWFWLRLKKFWCGKDKNQWIKHFCITADRVFIVCLQSGPPDCCCPYWTRHCNRCPVNWIHSTDYSWTPCSPSPTDCHSRCCTMKCGCQNIWWLRINVRVFNLPVFIGWPAKWALTGSWNAVGRLRGGWR